jgi:hypothetical protein
MIGIVWLPLGAPMACRVLKSRLVISEEGEDVWIYGCGSFWVWGFVLLVCDEGEDCQG